MRKISTILLLVLLCINVSAQSTLWEPMDGPYGGRFSGVVQYKNKLIALVNSCGIHVSSDTGATWKPIQNELVGKFLNELILKDTILLACGQDGIYISTDEGLKWKKVYNYSVKKLYVFKDKIIGGDIYSPVVSDDNGQTWKNTNSPKYLSRFASDGNTLYGISTFVDYVFKSEDGVNWSIYSSYKSLGMMSGIQIVGAKIMMYSLNGIYSCNIGDTVFTQSNNVAMNVIDLYNSQDTVYAFTREGMYTSSDTGKTWILKDPECNDDVFCMLKNKEVFFAFNRTKLDLLKYNFNHKKWLSSSKGINCHTFNDLTFYGDRTIATATFGGIFQSRNMKNWQQIYKTKPYNNALQALSSVIINNKVFVGGNTIYRLGSDSVTWYPQKNLHFSSVRPIIKGDTIISASYGYVFIITDTSKASLQKQLDPVERAEALTKFGSSIIAATGAKIFQSFDNGLTWKQLSTPFLNYKYTSDVTKVTVLNNTLFVSNSYAGIYATINGIDWIPMNNGFAGDVKWLTSYKNVLYAATRGKILFYSTNFGEKWHVLDSLKQHITYVEGKGNYLYATFYEGGIRRIGIDFITDLQETNFKNNQSINFYPNPACSTITLEVPWDEENVSLKISDLSGREMLNQKFKEPPFSIDISTFSPGIYFVRIENDHVHHISKLVVAR